MPDDRPDRVYCSRSCKNRAQYGRAHPQETTTDPEEPLDFWPGTTVLVRASVIERFLDRLRKTP
ncbi:MAG: hypothetical protein KIS66_16665 [Fimbriimonadaceae bacterium]|nr:hypothetical protein [Fimbriimonadaceae bacterium]